jgi:DNA-binding XRE family transcriptional regulator
MEYTNLIYGLRDPNNDVYKYIGKTTVGVQRPLAHLIKSHNELVNSWVDELKITGSHPIVDIIEKDVSLEELTKKERYYIEYYSSIHPLLNKEIGRHSKSRSIKTPSIILPTDVDTVYYALSDLGELYKSFKSMTGFTDESIASSLDVGRKTVYRIKENNQKTNLETVFKIIVFLKNGLIKVFDYYYLSSYEFQGKHPDTYEEFISECMINSKFCNKWFTAFYKQIIVDNTYSNEKCVTPYTKTKKM